jgi:CHAD domain-containing protein
MLGPLRDVQVQLRSLEKMLPSRPELQGFYGSLLRRERKLVRRLSTEIGAVKTGKAAKVMRAVMQQVEMGLATPEMRQEKWAQATLAVEAAFNRVLERKRAIDPTASASIHRMRVAFKKFRYMVESLAPLLGWVSSKQLKGMDAFQGRMGDIQDAEVLLTSVMTFARRAGAEREALLSHPLEELSGRRTALISTFVEEADRLYTFWRPNS